MGLKHGVRRVAMLGIGAALVVGSFALRSPLERSAAADVKAGDGSRPTALDPKRVWGSWFRSLADDPTGPWLPDAALDYVLNDTESLISNEFHIVPEMRDAVSFWLRIYTQYTSQQIVLFDDEHMNVVYKVIDLRPIAERARNRMAYEIMAKRKIVSTIKAYRAAMLKLAKHPHPKTPNEIEQSIIAAVGNLNHEHSYKRFAKNVRAQTGQRDFVVEGLENVEPFMMKMEKVFTSVDVPKELVRLSLVESSFNTNAVSRVGAVGVWQFMERSAREYMFVNRRVGVDERLSPLKSSVAAARLLKRNRQYLGNWAFAITAYNQGHGPFKPYRDKKLTGAQIARLLASCDSLKKLGFAGRNYWAEFLAMTYAEQYRKLFFPDLQPVSLKALSFTKIKSAATGEQIAKRLQINIHEFRDLNPDIRDVRKTLPVGYLIATPQPDEDLAVLFRRRTIPRSI